jgi:hypothetical protein
MKVSTLQLFLRSLRPAVTAADSSSSLSADLEAVSAGLEPFARLEFGQFAAFLRQAEQFRNSGAVTVPSTASLGAAKVQTGLGGAASLADKLSGEDALDAQHVTAAREKVRQELEQALDAFLRPLAIKVTLKGDQKRFQTALKKAGTHAIVAQVRAALDGVTDEASLNAPERQHRLQALVNGLPLADVKAAAAELGAQASARSKEALLSAIVEQVTGVKSAAKKPTRSSRKPAVDQAAVQQQAVKLKALLEKSFDPGGLSSEELEGAMSDLGRRGDAELQAIALEIGLEKVSKKKDGVLKQIREKLQEAERARQSIKV